MTKQEVIQAVSEDADMSDGFFRGVDYCNLNLMSAKFTRCDFTDALLRGADLTEVNMTGAILRGADLRGAQMSGGTFCGADFTGADLSDADIEAANFDGAIGIFDAGKDDRGYRFVGVKRLDGSWMVKAGCRWFTIEEAFDHWDALDNEDAGDRVAAIEEHAKATA